jgi:N6-adenosine-specific RNA methylase IME4
LSSERRAELLNVGRASVERADLVQNHAARELVEAVDRGAIAVSAAAELAALPAERLQNLPRDQVTGKLTPEVKKALAPVIKEIRAEKQGEKKERRATREQALGRKLQAEPVKHYGVVLEDFEWDHEPWSRETGMDRHPSNHYPTAADAHTPEEIVARTADRFACAADDCVLYAWTTIPHEAIAHRVLELRGFKYVTQRAWIKTRPGNGRGPGYWVTGEHEILLVAVRGNVVPPATAHFRSCFEAPVGEHSEKPDQQYEHAEFHFPNLPKIELNARRARPGWKPWGFEAPPSHHEISEPADGFDPAHGATGGVLTPAMVAEQAGEPEAGETMTAGAGAASSPTLLAPADPAAVEGGRGHAPETNSSDHHDLDIPEFLRRPLKQTELDLTRRDRAAPEVVDGALQTRLPLTSDEIEMQSALRAIDAGHDVDWSIMRHLVGAGFVHATTTRLSVTDEGRAFLAQLVGLPTKAHAVAVRA